MKRKITLTLAALTAVNVFFCGTVSADEKTGREIKEVLGDLTQELNVAQEKVAKIEKARLAQKNANAKTMAKDDNNLLLLLTAKPHCHRRLSKMICHQKSNKAKVLSKAFRCVATLVKPPFSILNSLPMTAAM